MQVLTGSRKPLARTPDGTLIGVPPEYWDELVKRDLHMLCAIALADPLPPAALRLAFLDRTLVIDMRRRTVACADESFWQMADRSLVELLVLVYLLRAKPRGLAGEMIAVQQLKDARFFQGPHLLDTGALTRRYGQDAEGFAVAAGRLAGRALDMADVAFALTPFPRIPLYYLLWQSDAEFDARLSILFDRSIEHHFAADAIWGTVNLVSRLLL